MIYDSRAFAKRYAFLYTVVLAILLVAPLVFYVQLLLQIDKAKVELSLEHQTKEIMLLMQRHSNKDKVFYYPRYKVYKSALYTDNYKVIFSTLNFKPHSFYEGIHKDGDRYYMVYALPKEYYFGASYILVSTVHTAYSIYLFASLVMIAIVLALFVFSFLLLKNFSRPFEQLNDQLDSFIKDSMHEINTPLTIINLNSDLFSNKYGENKYLLRIKSASKTLSTIYNDMDYLVKEGRIDHKSEMVDVSQFIEKRVLYFQEISNLKDIEIENKIEEGILYCISKVKLERVVDNTMSNAIKYSHSSSIINISLYKDKDRIVFEVKDSGVGIKDVTKIFSRYYREDEAKGGFGIGLNIVKKIIDEENIKLKVDSIYGKGATFRYELSV